MLEAHDRFILGEGVDGRRYVVHTVPPRFVAELFESETLVVSGDVIALRDHRVLGNLVWIGSPLGVDMAALTQDIEMFFEVLDPAE